MTDDTTGVSRHISLWIDATAAAVYEFAADEAQLTRWAAGPADPALAGVEVEFAPRNELGVLDLKTCAACRNERLSPGGTEQTKSDPGDGSDCGTGQHRGGRAGRRDTHGEEDKQTRGERNQLVGGPRHSRNPHFGRRSHTLTIARNFDFGYPKLRVGRA